MVDSSFLSQTWNFSSIIDLSLQPKHSIGSMATSKSDVVWVVELTLGLQHPKCVTTFIESNPVHIDLNETHHLLQFFSLFNPETSGV